MRTLFLDRVSSVVLRRWRRRATCEERAYTVAYASFGPLNSAIYVADADGSHERMVIGGPMLDMNPSFSPDGRSILFTSRRQRFRGHLSRGDGRLTARTADRRSGVRRSSGDVARRPPVAFVSSRSGQADVWILDLPSRHAAEPDQSSRRRLSSGVVARRAVAGLYFRPRFRWRSRVDASRGGARSPRRRRPSSTPSAPTGPASGDSPTARRPSAARPGRATARVWSFTRQARRTGAP